MKQIAKRNNLQWISIVCIIVLLLSSCSSTKYLKDGEILYTGASIKIIGDSLSNAHKKEMRESLEELLRPIPNSTLFGFRYKLFFYNFGGNPDKTGKFRRWMRTKLGEPPVLFNQNDMFNNQSILTNRVENVGFFNAEVTFEEKEIGEKKMEVNYTVRPGNQYTIKNVTFVNDSTPIQQLIHDAGTRWSELKKGKPYSLEKIKEERERLDAYAKNKGYYFFSPNNLIVQVDSTVGKHQVDLFVKVKEDTPALAEKPFTIGNIYVYSDYSLLNPTSSENNSEIKPYKDLDIIDPKNKFKPFIFDRAIYFKKGDLYSRTAHNLSLNRLVNLGVFKHVKNNFEIKDSLNNVLDVYYYLTPEKPKSIRLELLGKTNSASYNGVELNLNWSHKNIFRGAELLSISAYGGADFQLSSKGNGYDVYKAGLEGTLTFPRLITPWNFHSSTGFVPRTRAVLGGEYLYRTQLYSLQSFKASWGYVWKESSTKEHQLDVMDINYVIPQNVTELYKETAKGNPSMERILDKQLIFGPTYYFTYSNIAQQRKKNTYYYRGGLDLSGNIVGLLMKADSEKGNEKDILGVPFSQYIRTEHDIRHYRKLSKTSQLVSRIHAGIGYSYGNSTNLPYSKQFFVGGSNSIRAFRARTLGPGSFDPTTIDSKFIPDQTGDILLEFNLEYRKKIYGIVNGALFIDGGNVWNLNTVSDRPGGTFSKDFYKEIALGAGFGLRFDITFLVLRFDFAFPLRIPYRPENERWVIKDIDFGSKQWRKDNLMFNLAIGYPF